jgi:hypothetical protein
MGLFDAFSASDETQNFRQGYGLQSKELRKGRKALNREYNAGQTALETAKTEGLRHLDDANAIARGDVTGAQAAGQDYLTSGTNTAAGFYDQALNPFQQLYDMGSQGVDAHWNLTQNPDSIYDSELYKSREAAGIDTINRLANSRGMLASGNNSQDLLDYMRQGGLDYFTALTNQYQPYFGMAQNAAQGQSNVLGQKAGMYDQLGRSQAGLAQWGGGQLSDLASQLGANQSNIATGTGTQISGLRQNLGNALAGTRNTQGQAGSDMYTNMANAESAADSNLWGAILGLGGGLASAYGA